MRPAEAGHALMPLQRWIIIAATSIMLLAGGVLLGPTVY